MKLFGHMPNGENVFQVTIESSDLQLKVLSLGAIIQDIRMRNVTHSLVLGYPRLEPYFINSGTLGAVVGRYANRISNGNTSCKKKRICHTPANDHFVYEFYDVPQQIQFR